MRTAYINKENTVAHIAAFEEDKIIPNARGKLLFTAGGYDPLTRSYAHTLGRGEEVFAVDGSGLGLGDTYIAPTPIEPAPAPQRKSLQEAITSKQAELQSLRQIILDAQADENEPLLAELRPQRDRLKQELAVLEKELEETK